MLTSNETHYGMQYVGQTSSTLKNRFGEHYRGMKKPTRFDNVLYQQFKRDGYSLSNVSVQPVDKMIYYENSSSKFKLSKGMKQN